MTLSLRRESAQRILFECIRTELLAPNRLAEIEACFRAAQPAAVDHKPRITELELRIANFVKTIGEGLYSPEVNAALAATRTELEGLNALSPIDAGAARVKALRSP